MQDEMRDVDQRRQTYRFDDIQVDAHSHRVTRAGQEIGLEPKAFALLQVLLDRPGELLDRNRLIDLVWNRSFVAPATLNRLIAVLRRALGDDVAAPRYIETVHGLGYRFVGPLREVARGALTADARPTDYRTDGRPMVAMPSHGDITPRRRGRIGWLMMGTSALLLMLALSARLWEYIRPELARDTGTTPATLAVLRFESSDVDNELKSTVDGLAESLIDTLSRIPGLRVTGRESVFAIDYDENPQRAMHKLGVRYALTGQVIAHGTEVELRYGLWQAGAPAPLWLESRSMPRAQLFRALLPVSERVRLTLSPASSNPTAVAMSVSAQDLYWLGRHYTYERTPASLARALDYFQRAIDEDPQFALAYCGLADSYMLLSEYGNISIDDASAKAHAAVAQAKVIAPGLIDAVVSQGLILLDENHFDDAVVTLGSAVERDPNHPNAMLWYGNALSYSGRVNDALQWHRRASEIDPLSAVVQTYMGLDRMLAGAQGEADAYFKRALELNSEYAEAYWQIALQHALHGRSAQAVAAYRDAERHHAADGWTALFLADCLLRIGALGPARELVNQTASLPQADRLELNVALALADGQAPRALSEIQKVTAQGHSADRINALRAQTLSMLGRDAEARDLYSALFAANIDRADSLTRLWSPDFSMMHFANWVSLQPADAQTRTQALDALTKQLDRFDSGGMDVPVLHYQRAVLAALRGAENDAQRELTNAQDAGWLDVRALDRDLAWRRFATSPWLNDQRSRLVARARVQAELLTADANSQRSSAQSAMQN